MTEAIRELVYVGLNQQIQFKRMEVRCESTNYKSRFIPEKLILSIDLYI